MVTRSWAMQDKQDGMIIEILTMARRASISVKGGKILVVEIFATSYLLNSSSC